MNCFNRQPCIRDQFISRKLHHCMLVCVGANCGDLLQIVVCTIQMRHICNLPSRSRTNCSGRTQSVSSRNVAHRSINVVTFCSPAVSLTCLYSIDRLPRRKLYKSQPPDRSSKNVLRRRSWFNSLALMTCGVVRAAENP